MTRRLHQTIVFIVAASWCALAPSVLAQCRDTVRQPESKVPGGIRDFNRGPIVLQDMNITGKRYFTAESSPDRTASDIVAPADDTLHFCRIVVDTTSMYAGDDQPLPRWHRDAEMLTPCNLIVRPSALAGDSADAHVYRRVVSSSDAGTSGDISPFPAVTPDTSKYWFWDPVNDQDLSWQLVYPQVFSNSEPVWQPHRLYHRGDTVRGGSANAAIYRVASVLGSSMLTDSTLGIRPEPIWPVETGAQVGDTTWDGANVRRVITWEEAGPYGASDVDLRATGIIRLEDGFSVARGCYLHAYTKPAYTHTCLDEEFNDSVRYPKYWKTVDESGDYDYRYRDSTNRQVSIKIHRYWSAANVALDASEPDGKGGHGVLNLTASFDTTFRRGGVTYPLQEAMIEGFADGNLGATPLFSGGYGRYDVRAKVSSGPGAFTALWMFGKHLHGNVPGAQNPFDRADLGAEEFDLLENANWYGDRQDVTGHPAGEAWFNKNCPNFGQYTYFAYRTKYGSDAPGLAHEDFAPFALGDDYHVYSMEWEPGAIRFLLDDRVISRIPEVAGFDYPRDIDGVHHQASYILTQNIYGKPKHNDPMQGFEPWSQIGDISLPYTAKIDYARMLMLDACSEPDCHCPDSSIDLEAGSGADLQAVDGLLRLSVHENPVRSGAIDASVKLPTTEPVTVTLELYDLLGNRCASGSRTVTNSFDRIGFEIPKSIGNGAYVLTARSVTETGQFRGSLRVNILR